MCVCIWGVVSGGNSSKCCLNTLNIRAIASFGKLGGWGCTSECQRCESSGGSRGMLPRENLEISLSENIFPAF